MRTIIILSLLLLCACGGSLSSEQRKKMRENMNAKGLKKISDAELTEASLVFARTIAAIIDAEDKHLVHRNFLDSLGKSFGVQILSMQPSNTDLRGVERQIIEAYTSGSDLSGVDDNLQKMGADSLLYTKPIMLERPDGSVEFSKALAIRIPKKRVILTIKE